jgi:HPt (histidine-containing phosphotransfer) domain-containing protein
MSNERPAESHRDPAASGGPIRSEFADDRDMIELVRSFVDEMDARIRAIEGAATEGDAERLATVAHQLKGAAGGYGFPVVSEVAWGLERALRHEGQDLADLRIQIDELLAVCRRVSR